MPSTPGASSAEATIVQGIAADMDGLTIRLWPMTLAKKSDALFYRKPLRINKMVDPKRLSGADRAFDLPILRRRTQSQTRVELPTFSRVHPTVCNNKTSALVYMLVFPESNGKRRPCGVGAARLGSENYGRPNTYRGLSLRPARAPGD